MRLDQLNAALGEHYRVERELGAGGMATVYLAEDLKHHRKVAIKVLREDLALSVGRERFLREIEIAARLQHPNILPLLDSGDAGGLLFYVMPYVDGQSLRGRLDREHELPVGEAVRLLIEITDALSHAHQLGVVHRDIKPDNVMLSGRHALVADFGVAKAVSEATGNGTVTSMGVALGTPAYMAPEQAAADPHVDHRADIYAVGVMGYELLAGTAPFTGRTPQQILAAQVTQAPDPLSRHRVGINPVLESAIMRCLEKRPADRWQSADELLSVLEPLATPSGGTVPTSARLVATPAVHRRRSLLATGAVILGAAIAFAAWGRMHEVSAPFVMGRSDQLTSDQGLEIQPAISPDGKMVAYGAGTASRMRIFLRPVGGGRTIPISDDSTAVEYAPRWSPDGSHLLYLVHGGVSTSSALGAATRAIIPRSDHAVVSSAVWSPDGRDIAFVRQDSLLAVTVEGGAARFITKANNLHSCDWSPDANWIACVTLNNASVKPGSVFGNRAPSRIVLVPAAGGAVREIVPASSFNLSPVWSRDSRILYFLSNRDGPEDVYGLRLTADAQPRGTPMRVTTGLNAMSFSMSADGTRLAYALFTVRANVWSLPIPEVPPVSTAQAVPVTTGTQVIEGANVSPDGRWLVFDSNVHGTANIYRMPIAGGTAERLTSDPFEEFGGTLSPDGRSIAYYSFRNGSRDVEVKPLNGGPVELVTTSKAQESFPAWSPDGRSLLFFDQDAPSACYVASRDSQARWSARMLATACHRPVWTRDGRSVLMEHVAPGKRSVLTLLPLDGGPPRALDTGESDEEATPFITPSSNGREVYVKYVDSLGIGIIRSVPLAGGASRVLVRFDDPLRPSTRPELSTDGRRFYFTVQDRQSDVYVADITRR